MWIILTGYLPPVSMRETKYPPPNLRYSPNFSELDNIWIFNVSTSLSFVGLLANSFAPSHTLSRYEYSAVVYMDIEAGYDNLPKDTAASILTAGLLGAQYIGLDPGGDFEFLVDGDELDITQSALVLENLIGQFLFSQSEKEE